MNLLDILALVNGVESSKWEDVRKIVKIMPSIEVREKSWRRKYMQENPDWYPLDLSKFETWSTYDGSCIDLDFENEENKIICKVSIYDGDVFDGHRKDLRFTATLVMPDEFIKELEPKIMSKLNRFAEESYKNHLERQKKLWISNFKNEILKETI